MSSEANPGSEADDTPIEYVPVAEHPKLDERRLTVAEYVRRRDASVSLSDLAAEIVEWERGGGDRDEASVRRMQIRLHHVDLPLLEDLGFLTYDATRRVVL